ncbi:hypothetical protein ACFVIM_32575 [Streptomyces sp. NPDC057638]|uniref:hypothetical protein n=1 Tax=Streptomyces sp. NPDC057638 TaxID=3346190 RepID=UPI0036BA6C38
MRKKKDLPPVSFLEEGEWPTGRLAADAPATARLGQILAARLARALADQGLSARAIGERARCTHPTIARILDGTGSPDAQTVLHLEIALQRHLWPSDLHEGLTLPPAPERDTAAGQKGHQTQA